MEEMGSRLPAEDVVAAFVNADANGSQHSHMLVRVILGRLGYSRFHVILLAAWVLRASSCCVNSVCMAPGDGQIDCNE